MQLIKNQRFKIKCSHVVTVFTYFYEFTEKNSHVRKIFYECIYYLYTLYYILVTTLTTKG